MNDPMCLELPAVRGSHVKNCCYCGGSVNELSDTHVKDGGFPDQGWWHIDCWNEIHEGDGNEVDLDRPEDRCPPRE